MRGLVIRGSRGLGRFRAAATLSGRTGRVTEMAFRGRTLKSKKNLFSQELEDFRSFVAKVIQVGRDKESCMLA